MVATDGKPQMEQTCKVLSILILSGLYLRKSCHTHSPVPIDLKIHTAQTRKLAATSALQPSTGIVSTCRLYFSATPHVLQGICKAQACLY